ncbi:transmembrane alpha-helix domain-containing protein [Colletotrichum plurivorum]|uniref:Transmembrane alpha-helix domain-containing protein n=1 Tax=Colletotrichum plurivorum TaxID=2175906 RepID=A0A8H6J9N3_9PEZI|nr:transmembrane alpha-helix domain-containing protein [Colletotrichum plurivorum]
MVFSKSGLLALALVALSLNPVIASPLQSGNVLVERDPQQRGPARFSCSCVANGKRKMSSTICNGAGGATGVDPNKDGEACNGLTTKLTTQDCQALIDPASKVECVQTG